MLLILNYKQFMKRAFLYLTIHMLYDNLLIRLCLCVLLKSLLILASFLFPKVGKGGERA